MMMNDELISVLIPMYNSEKYINNCLNTILKQTYTNFEVIVLDDGSTDNSYHLVEELTKKDSRVKLFQKQNEKSVSITRNALLKLINGKYFIFVDSDDEVSVHFLEFLYKALKESDSDVCSCEYTMAKNNYSKIKRIKQLFTYNNRDALIEMILGKKGHFMVWNKLIKTEIVKDKIEFKKELNYGEDFVFTIDLYSQNIKTCFINNRLYFYRVRRNSISRNGFNQNKKNFLQTLIEMENDSKYSEIKFILTIWICVTSGLYLSFIKCKKGYKKYREYLKETIASHYYIFKENKKMRLMYRAFTKCVILFEGIKIRRN